WNYAADWAIRPLNERKTFFSIKNLKKTLFHFFTLMPETIASSLYYIDARNQSLFHFFTLMPVYYINVQQRHPRAFSGFRMSSKNIPGPSQGFPIKKYKIFLQYSTTAYSTTHTIYCCNVCT